MCKIISLSLLTVSLVISSFSFAGDYHSKVVYVYDVSSEKELISINADVQRPIVSLTKLVTAMVSVDENKLTTEAKVTAKDAKNAMYKKQLLGSNLPVGVTLTRKQHLKLALMASQNRSASVLAHSNDSKFIRKMNDKLKAIGTKAVVHESTGLNHNNVATAKELYLITRYVYNNYPLINELSVLPNLTVYYDNKSYRFKTTNAIVLDRSLGIKLQKTGYTRIAGFCSVTVHVIKDRTLIIVLMGAPTPVARAADVRLILKSA